MAPVDGWTAAGPEVERAARLVLGRELGTGVCREELRRAFRSRALELHPDRAAAVGRDAHALAEEFRALCSAHELLDGVAGAEGEAAEARPPPGRREGGLPPRLLRFAEFLYYEGRIGWADLAGALAWRRHAGRPIGSWFVARGLLARAEVRAVREALARHNEAYRP